jgi:hypothetical protein
MYSQKKKKKITIMCGWGNPRSPGEIEVAMVGKKVLWTIIKTFSHGLFT